MKKLIIALLVVFILMTALAACTRNNTNNSGDGTGTGSGTTNTTATTTKNDGMVSDTGTDTNIIDKIESDIVGSDTTAKK